MKKKNINLKFSWNIRDYWERREQVKLAELTGYSLPAAGWEYTIVFISYGRIIHRELIKKTSAKNLLHSESKNTLYDWHFDAEVVEMGLPPGEPK